MIAAASQDWPLSGLSADMRPRLAQLTAERRPAALATLYTVTGPSPRPPGTQMLVEADRFSGYLSGGCVESDVAAHGRAALADGRPRRLVYGEGSPFRDIRLLCGGRLEILVEPLRPAEAAVGALLDLRDRRVPALWSSDGVHRRCTTADSDTPEMAVRAAPFGIEVFYPPPLRLIVAGGDPIALAIAQLGVTSGIDTWVLRQNGPAAPPFEGVGYDRGDPAEALARIGLDPWTAVAACSHDLELDEAVLAPALRSDAPYVGALGARRRIPERLARLRRAGASEAALQRLRAPIGLDIGAASPMQIAIAVHAELVTVLQSRGRRLAEAPASRLSAV